jgi:transcriptional regulator with XRE-family HTH domain
MRRAAGLSLRAVQERTQGRVKNGYLSQIEHGDIKSPSPTVLHDLAEVYGLDYTEVLRRAGHPVPADDSRAATRLPRAIAGIPVAALSDLTDTERREVLDFLAFVKSRRATA